MAKKILITITLIISLLLVFGLFGCTTPPAEQKLDPALAGTWTFQNGAVKGSMSFYSDGKANVETNSYQADSPSPSIEGISIDCNYTTKNNVLTMDCPNTPIPPKHIDANYVIDGNTLSMTSIQNGYSSTIVLYREGTQEVNQQPEFPNLSDLEKQLCKNSTVQGVTFELMRVDKCNSGDNQFYVKDESTMTVTDLGRTLIFDKNGTLTCEHAYAAIGPECGVNRNSCEKICSTGGW